MGYVRLYPAPPAAGEILFGDHFDAQADWRSGQAVPSPWGSHTYNDGGGDYYNAYINALGAHGTGKGLIQYWDQVSLGYAQDCWMNATPALPDDFWFGYWFQVDPSWDWGSAASLKVVALRFNNNATMHIHWGQTDYTMPSPWSPPGGGFSLSTYTQGQNWFSRWTDVGDGDWHSFVWHVKHSTGTLECFVDGVDAALTSNPTAFPGTGFDAVFNIGGNLSDGGGGVDEMWTKYDDVCIGTTRAVVEAFLGL